MELPIELIKAIEAGDNLTVQEVLMRGKCNIKVIYAYILHTTVNEFLILENAMLRLRQRMD